MLPEALLVHERPMAQSARMVMGFSGWMDGGEVSTETVAQFIHETQAKPFADLDPAPFFLYNVPGDMDLAAQFRPHVYIEDGMVTRVDEPVNRFFYSESCNLVLFLGKEPHMRWADYVACLFAAAQELDVREIFFVGSVAGTIPHTKTPHFYGSVSCPAMRSRLLENGIELSSYEGPGSFVSYMIHHAPEYAIAMASLVAEIPAYVHGKNLKCIESAAHRLAILMELPLTFSTLHAMTSEFEERLSRIVRSRPELSDMIHKMEQNYDREHQDEHMDELRAWFEKQHFDLGE